MINELEKIREFFDVIIKGDFDTYRTLIHDDYQIDNALKYYHSNRLIESGVDAMVERTKSSIASLMPVEVKILESIQEEDKVCVFIEVTYRQLDEWNSVLPTNKQVTTLGAQLFRFKDNKIYSMVVLRDHLNTLNQLQN